MPVNGVKYGATSKSNGLHAVAGNFYFTKAKKRKIMFRDYSKDYFFST